MNILYDATPLLMRSAGVKNYHYSLLRELLPIAWPHDIALFPYLDGLPENRNEESNYPRFETAARLAGILASNYLRFPIASRAARDSDLFHVTPHVMRPPEEALLTAIVHDATPLTLPECHTESNIRYFERFAERVLPRLDGVITPSEAVKQDLIDSVGVAEDKVTVIHHGVDQDFFEVSGAQIRVAHRTYELPDRYILTVGSFEPRKNLVRLIEAHARLPMEIQKEYPLLAVGASGWKNSQIERAFRESPHARILGYVKRELLPAVYESASAFALPSLYEGFGMPLLEAMAAGLPVLTSNTSAPPEVVGKTGVLVDPLDVGAITEGLRLLVGDPRSAQLMGAEARQRARGFSWQRCAEETKGFFGKVGGDVDVWLDEEEDEE